MYEIMQQSTDWWLEATRVKARELLKEKESKGWKRLGRIRRRSQLSSTTTTMSLSRWSQYLNRSSQVLRDSIMPSAHTNTSNNYVC
jgi:hypothetical protein